MKLYDETGQRVYLYRFYNEDTSYEYCSYTPFAQDNIDDLLKKFDDNVKEYNREYDRIDSESSSMRELSIKERELNSRFESSANFNNFLKANGFHPVEYHKECGANLIAPL